MSYSTIAHDLFSWSIVGVIGFFTATEIDYAEDIHKTLVTVVSMSLGAIAVFFIKKALHKFWNKKIKKR